MVVSKSLNMLEPFLCPVVWVYAAAEISAKAFTRLNIVAYSITGDTVYKLTSRVQMSKYIA